MRNLAFFLLGVALLIVQTQLFRVLGWTGMPGLTPSLVLPLILFMGVHEHSLARGATVAFALGYETDIIGCAPGGLYTFTYVALYVLARAAYVRLAAQTLWMQMVLAATFALVHSVMLMVLLTIFGGNANTWVPLSLAALVIPHVLATGTVAPLVFGLARKIHAATAGSPRADAGGGRA